MNNLHYILKSLIEKQFYADEEILNKLDVFYAMNRLSEKEYKELSNLVKEISLSK